MALPLTKWETGPRRADFRGRQVALRISVWDKLGSQVHKNRVRAEEPGLVAMPRVRGEGELTATGQRTHLRKESVSFLKSQQALPSAPG